MAKKIIVRNEKRGCLWWTGILFLVCLAIAVLAYAACVAAGIGLWFLIRYCWRKLAEQAPDSKFVKKMSGMPRIVRQVAAGIFCAMISVFLLAALAGGTTSSTKDTSSTQTTTVEKKSEPSKKKSSKTEQVTAEKASEKTAEQDETPVLTDLVVKFIDVGQGDASLIEFPDGKTMLIDTPSGHAGTVQNTLKADDRSKIDWLVATHPDSDHIGGLDTVLKYCDVDAVWAPEVNSPTQTYSRFLTAISDKGLSIEPAYAGRKIATGENYSIDILWPQQGASYSEDNAYSVVIKVTYGENTFLFTGDAPVDAQNQCVDGHVDVLKVSHHGSASGLNSALAGKLTPKIAVLSYGKNSYGHPTQVVLDALSGVGAQVYGTFAHGTITVTSNGKEVTASASHEGTIEAASQDAGADSQGIGTAGGGGGSSGADAAPAETTTTTVDSGSDETVVVTPSGSKYHRPGCRTLSRSKSLTEMSKTQAQNQGLGPCGVCHP